MAGKKGGKGQDFDDFDIGDLDDGLLDLDFGEDDADSKSRKPVQKVKSGMKMGIQSSLDSPDFRRRFLKGSLPKEYSSGLEGAREIISEGRNLYNTTSEEVRQTGREVRDFLSRTVPSSRRFIPDKLAQKINEWLGDEEQESRDNHEKNLEESEIETALGEIFKIQAEEEAKKEEDDQLRKDQERTIDKRRFKNQQNMLGRMVSLQERVAAYQDNVTIAYQRKHLELEMRQYNVLRKIHQVLVQDSKNQDRIQRDILHNTSLPDFQKIKRSESFKESIRERLYGSIAEGPLIGVSSLMRKYAKDLSENMLSGFRNNMEAVRDAARAGSDVGDIGIDKYTFGGMMAGNFGSEFLARRLGKRLRGLINRNPNAARRGRQFSRVFGDIERFANTFSSGDSSEDYYKPRYDKEGNEIREGFFRRQGRRLRRAVRQKLPSYAPDQTLLVKSRPGSLNEPDLITNRFTRTVEEVIPKLLSMIYGEVRSTRTGKPVGAFHYDFAARKVVGDKEAAGELRNKLFSESRRESVNEDVQNVLKEIDPDDKLSPSARKALRDRIIREARLNRQFSPKEFSSNTGWGDANASDVGEIGDLIRNRFGYKEGKGFGQTLEDEERRDAVDKQLLRLATYTPNAKNDVLNMVRAGNLNAARATGLVNETDQGWFFDEEKYFKYLINGERPDLMDTDDLGGEGGQPGSPAPSAGKPRAPKGGPSGNILAKHTNRIVEALNKGFADIKSLLGEAPREQGFPPSEDDPLVEINKTTNVWLEEISEQIRNIRAYGINLGEMGESVKRGYRSARTSAGEAFQTAQSRLAELRARAQQRYESARQWVSEKAKEVQDAYVEGRVAPALRAELIKGREYVDVNTGKIIEKLSDVTGEVRNRAGDVVVTAEEYKEGLLDKHGDKLVQGIVAAQNFVRESVPRFFRSIPGVLREARQQAHNLLDGPEDVYVVGEKKPRLYARVMRDRGYVSKESGHVIRRPRDIEGEVVDEDGNVILSEEDLEKGIVDKNGDEFIGISGKLANTIEDVRDRFRMGRFAALSAAKDLGAKALGVIGNAIGSLEGKSFPGLIIGGQKELVTSVDRIYNLLAPKFGGEPIGQIGGDIKETASKAVATKNWLQDRARRLRASSFGDKRRIVEERRKAAAQGQRFGLPMGLSLGGIKSAWEKAKDVRDRQKERAGSWVQIMRDRRKKKEQEAKKPGAKRKKKGGLFRTIAGAIFSGLGMVGSTLFGGIAGGFGAIGKTIIGGFRAIPAAARGIMWVAKKGLPLVTRTLFTLGKYISKNIIKGFVDIGRLLMFSIGGLGKGVMKLTKRVAGGFMKGGAVRKAGSAALNAAKNPKGLIKGAGGWLGRAALGAGRFLAMRALPAVAGAIFSPIGLGIAAVAALAFGGYKLYQYIKSKDAILVRMRLVHYGIDFGDEDQVNKIDRLEQALIKDVRIDKDGVGKIESRLKPKDLLDIFDIQPDDSEAVAPWTEWFIRRFKPMFLKHIAALRTIFDRYRVNGTQADLLEIDKKLETWQAKYDFAVRVKDQTPNQDGRYPTEYMSSPFPGIELEYDRTDTFHQYNKYVNRLKGLREDEIDEEGQYQTAEKGDKKNDWSKTSRERERLFKERERRMQQNKQAEAWRTEEERLAKKRLEAAMEAAGAATDFAGKTKPTVDQARDLYERAVEGAEIKRNQANEAGWLWPTVGGRISSMYGRRIDPISGKPAGHGGIDIAAPIGTPIFAAFRGYIIRRAYSQSYGNVIYLKHPDGRCSRYAHMERFEPGLSVGDLVEAGDIIGYMGSTGKSTGSHLHFEIRKNDDTWAPTMDPLTVVTDPKVQEQAEEVVQEAKKENQGDERDFKDDPTSPMEGKDTIASTLAGKATEPKGSAARKAPPEKPVAPSDAPVSEVAENVRQTSEEREEKERQQRRAESSTPTDASKQKKLADTQRQQADQRKTRARQEAIAREHEQSVMGKSATSTSKMVQLNEEQLALQTEMRDALLKIASATRAFETLTPETLKAFMSPKKESDYQPNNPPPGNFVERRPSGPVPQANPVVPMR